MPRETMKPPGLWIESHVSLEGHFKTTEACRLLSIPVPHLIGHLHCLWHWAMVYAQDGDLSDFSDEQIAAAAMWTGSAQAFVEALQKAGGPKRCGFLEYTPDGRLVLHDWDDYAGKLLEQRRNNADRQEKHRQKQRASTGEAHNGYVTVTSPLYNALPDLTQPNHYEDANASSVAVATAESASPEKSVWERYAERAKSEPNKTAVVHDALKELTGHEEDFGRVGKFVKDAGGPGEALRILYQALADWRGVDDPLSLCQKFLAGRKERAPPKGKRAVDSHNGITEEWRRDAEKHNEENIRRLLGAKTVGRVGTHDDDGGPAEARPTGSPAGSARDPPV